MTDDSATSAHHAAKTAYFNLGLNPAAVTSGISKAYFDALAPSVGSLVGPTFAASTMNIGSIIAQSIDTRSIRSLIAASSPSSIIARQLAQSYESFGKQFAPSIAQMYPVLQMAGLMGSDVELQKTISLLTSSVAQSIDTSFARNLLSQASTLRDELESDDFDDITADFFDQQPEVAASIEQLPFLVTLSTAERRLIVWFIGTIVAIYVTMGVVNISLDSEEFDALLGGLGIAGPASGVVAGKVTGKLLDKLPQAESIRRA